MSTAMRNFYEGPGALDLLAEFKKTYIALAERRSAELLKILNSPPGAEVGNAYEEYDRLRMFEPTLNRMIAAFVNEAIKPWQQAMVDISMKYPSPVTFPVNYEDAPK